MTLHLANWSLLGPFKVTAISSTWEQQLHWNLNPEMSKVSFSASNKAALLAFQFVK
jgi:hypothetical protein